MLFDEVSADKMKARALDLSDSGRGTTLVFPSHYVSKSGVNTICIVVRSEPRNTLEYQGESEELVIFEYDAAKEEEQRMPLKSVYKGTAGTKKGELILSWVSEPVVETVPNTINN